MIFHYHPILGLQYFNVDCDIVIDIAVIPKGFDAKDVLIYMKKTGMMIVNSSRNHPAKIKRIFHNLFEW